MDQQRVLMLIDALDEIGVAPQARQDARARASQSCGGHDVQEWEVRDFAQQRRKDAPHLFRQQASASTTAPAATGYSQGKRKELPQPPRSVSGSWDHLPPMERLGKLREWQAAQKSNT